MNEPIRRQIDNEEWIFDPGLALTAGQLDEIAALLKRTLPVAGTRRDLLELQRLVAKLAGMPVFIETPEPVRGRIFQVRRPVAESPRHRRVR